MSRFRAGASAPETIDDSLFKLAASKSNWNPNYRKWIPTFRETYGDLTKWTPITSTCAIEDDTVNYAIAGADYGGSAWVQTTGKAMKLTKTTTAAKDGKIDCTLAAPVDLSNCHGLLRYYVHEGTGSTSCTSLYGLYIWLWDATGKYAYWADTGISGTGARIFPGWRTFPMRMLEYNQVQDGFDITTVSKIGHWLQVYAGQEAATPSITLDSLEFFPKIQPPIPYCVTFDGGYRLQKDALAYLSARGIRANVFPAPDLIGSAEGVYMTVDDLQQAQNMGHIINFHERRTKPTGWFTLTETQKQESLKQSLTWLGRNGFTQASGFAPLETQWWNDRDITGSLNPYLQYVRIGGHARHTVPWNARIVGENFDSNTKTIADEATRRQEAIDRGTFFAINCHTLLPETSLPLADFKTMIDAAVADTNVRFCTIEELIETNWYVTPH